MPATCYGSVKGLAMRATRLDECGSPVEGPSGQVVSDGFVQMTFSVQIEEGEEFVVKTASGRLCINDKDCDQLKGIDLSIDFCQIDPELFELISGVRLVTDYAGNASGYALSEDLACVGGFALEVWTLVPGGTACETDAGSASGRYLYWLLPWVANGVIGGDLTVGNEPMTFTLNARTKANPNWGKGPYDVVAQDGAGTPGRLLDGVMTGEHLYETLTSVAPPESVCGYQELTVPPVVVATGATAGTPGTYTPSGAATPANLAALTGITASPNTAWTTGQYVLLGDATHAHWSGSAWAAGNAT